MSNKAPITSIAFVAAGCAVSAYFYWRFEERPSPSDWMPTIIGLLPFVVLTFGVWLAPCRGLTNVVRVLACLFAAIAFGLQRYIARYRGIDDGAPWIPLLFVVPMELLVAGAALGAVVMDRRRSRA